MFKALAPQRFIRLHLNLDSFVMSIGTKRRIAKHAAISSDDMPLRGMKQKKSERVSVDSQLNAIRVLCFDVCFSLRCVTVPQPSTKSHVIRVATRIFVFAT